MSEALSPRSSRRGWLALLQWSALGAAASVIVACGGGGVGAGGTGISSGTVTGFGSVIVNGIRYDDSRASVSGDDSRTGDDSKLRIGMVVEVESGSVTCSTDGLTCTATASSFSYQTELAGPVTDLATDGSSFKVLGQTVQIATGTNFFPATAGANLANGQIVKVHGRKDSAGAHAATFVERKAINFAALDSTSSFQYRLTGAYDSALGTVAGEKIDLGSNAAPANGAIVRVRIDPAAAKPTNGWLVERIQSARKDGLRLRGSVAKLEGSVAEFVSGTGALTFTINGYQVRVPAGSSVNYDDGASYAGLASGLYVEVTGSIDDAGVLVVNKVEFKSGTGAGAEREFYVSGSEMSAFTTTTFTVTKRNTDPVVVDFSEATFEQKQNRPNLSATDLVTGFGGKLEVKGTIDSQTGVFKATRIKRDD